MIPIPKRFAGHFLRGAKLSKSQLAELKTIASLFESSANGTRLATDPDPVALWNRFTSDPGVCKLLIPVPRTRQLRQACLRALAVFEMPLQSVRFDYAGGIRRLVTEWERALPDYDLPDRLRHANVRDRLDAKRFVRALLRRLDRIENRQMEARASKRADFVSLGAPAIVMRGAGKDYVSDSDSGEGIPQPPHPVWVDQPPERPVPVVVVGAKRGSSPRLQFDDLAHTVTIDGQEQIAVKNSTSYQVFKAIAGAAPAKILRAGIRNIVPSVNGDTAIPNAVRDLPKVLRAFVHRSTHGFWLRLPPRKKIHRRQ